MSPDESGSPPMERPAPPQHRPLPHHTDTSQSNPTPTVVAQHRRRRGAPWRSARRIAQVDYSSGGNCCCTVAAPPSEVQLDGYRRAVHHLAGAGLLPGADREGLVRMWKAGGADRELAELVADGWGLAR